MQKKLLSFLLLFNFLQAEKPRVSIITSVFDGDEFIAGFLSDITRQTIFEQCELIMVNANSPGQEEAIIKEYMKKFPNIIYKKLDKDPGLYAVWNIAIKMAKADFITNANLDDRRNPNSLEVHAKALENNSDADLVYSDIYVTSGSNETFECNTHLYSIIPEDFSPHVMYKCITGPQPMWRKNVHDKYGYFDESFLSGGDFEMWNRAVSMNSKFLKAPGVSGLFYLNPKGLSTAETNKNLIKTELLRINDKYGYMWIANLHYYCTASDKNYFQSLLNLIGSIHKTAFNSLGEIAVFDLGLDKEQIEQLNKIQKVSVHKIELTHPDLLKQFKTNHAGKTVPGWYAWKFVILKQALELFPYALWVDAGTTILKPLDNLFKYIEQSGYFLCTIGDEKLNNQIYHPIRWGATEFVKDYFNLNSQDKKWILDQEPLLSGTIGVSRKCLNYFVKPLYELSRNLRIFEDDGTTPNGFGTGRHDLIVLSIFAYLNGLTIHNDDYTQQIPIYLNIRNKYETFYVTWNREFVSDKTYLYNSRRDLSNFDEYCKAIKYKK